MSVEQFNGVSTEVKIHFYSPIYMKLACKARCINILNLIVNRRSRCIFTDIVAVGLSLLFLKLIIEIALTFKHFPKLDNLLTSFAVHMSRGGFHFNPQLQSHLPIYKHKNLSTDINCSRFR